MVGARGGSRSDSSRPWEAVVEDGGARRSVTRPTRDWDRWMVCCQRIAAGADRFHPMVLENQGHLLGRGADTWVVMHWGELLGTGKRPSRLGGAEPTIGPQRSVASRTVSGRFSLATESGASVKVSASGPRRSIFFFLSGMLLAFSFVGWFSDEDEDGWPCSRDLARPCSQHFEGCEMPRKDD